MQGPRRVRGCAARRPAAVVPLAGGRRGGRFQSPTRRKSGCGWTRPRRRRRRRRAGSWHRTILGGGRSRRPNGRRREPAGFPNARRVSPLFPRPLFGSAIRAGGKTVENATRLVRTNCLTRRQGRSDARGLATAPPTALDAGPGSRENGRRLLRALIRAHKRPSRPSKRGCPQGHPQGG